MKIVHAYSTLPDAQLAKLALESSGIDADILDEATATLAPHLTFASGIRLAVADEDFGAAREALGLPPVEPPPPVRTGKGVPWWAFVILGVAILGLFLKARPPAGREDDAYAADRNGDGKKDERYEFDARGGLKASWSDNNFDGRWDERVYYRNGMVERIESDPDFDGAFDAVTEFRHGVPLTTAVRKGGEGPILSLTTYRGGVLAHVLEDRDGDGRWDARIEYDPYGRESKREDWSGEASAPP